MDSYTELRRLFANGELRNKVEVACVIAAETIRNEAAGTENHANRLIWAKQNLPPSASTRDSMVMILLAANKDLEPAQITGASPAVIQAKVDEVIDFFADGS